MKLLRWRKCIRRIFNLYSTWSFHVNVCCTTRGTSPNYETGVIRLVKFFFSFCCVVDYSRCGFGQWRWLCMTFSSQAVDADSGSKLRWWVFVEMLGRCDRWSCFEVMVELSMKSFWVSDFIYIFFGQSSWIVCLWAKLRYVHSSVCLWMLMSTASRSSSLRGFELRFKGNGVHVG